MTQRQIQAKNLLSALENYYPSYFGSDRPISSNFKIENKVYPKKWVLEETFKLAEIPQDTSDIGVAIRKLEEIYASTTAETPAPEYVSNTTLTGQDLAEKMEAAAKRDAALKQTRENASRDVENTKNRIGEIIKEQQRINDLIAKAEAVKAEIQKTKDLYLKVEETKKAQFTEDERIKVENYKKEAIKNQEIAAIKFARELHTTADAALLEKGVSQEEAAALVNKTATRTIESFVESTAPEYVSSAAYVAINEAVLDHLPQNISVEAKEVISTSISTNNTYKYGPDLLYRDVLKTGFNENIADSTFGGDYKVTVSEVPVEGYSRYHFADANESAVQIYREQNQNLESIKGLGQDEARTYLFNQSATYFANSSAGRKILVPNSKAEMLFFSTFKNAGKTVTWQGSGAFANYAIERGYAPLLNLATGTKFVTPTIAQATSKIAGGVTGKVVGQVTAQTGAKGIVAAVAGLGSLASLGASIVIGFITNKIIDKLPQIKKWLSENSVPLGIAAGFGGAVVFGAGPGIIIGLGAITLAGGLAPFLMSTMGILGFIGSSLAITIATPVIIALLVLPPLIAFIMLVINNSAYIVPPSISTLANIGQVVSPYIDIQKTASPEGPFENTDLPKTIEYTVTINAKKSNLTDIKIEDECSVRKKSGSTQCPQITPSLPDTSKVSVSPTQPYSFTYSMTFNSANFIDSRVSNAIKITATADGNETEAVGSSSIKFGNPPEDCPADWPVYPENEPYLVILQGPHTRGGTHDVIEAIDIFSPDEPNTTDIIGNQVKATHQGKVVVGSGGNYGRYVDVTSMCKKTDGGEVEITTRYAHLSAIGVSTGQIAGKDQTIGLAGSSGTPYPHLHYEFRDSPGPLPMKPPYLPKSIPVGCFNAQNKPCGITY